MGWLYTYRRPRTKIADFFKNEFNYDNENAIGEVIDCKVVKLTTAYIAYKRTCKHTGKVQVSAIVCLLHYQPNSYHNFGYKDMDECMGPYYTKCPRSILEKLSPTKDSNAIRWRNYCWERLDKTSARV
jgi:hypothetical protein